MATSNEHYSVISYNMGSYEIIHPIQEKSDRARYIMVTDDPNLKDETGSWEVVYDATLSGSSFDKVMQVRYFPFKYTDDMIVVKVDGSVGINKSLDALVDKFIDGGYDLSIMLHPTRSTMFEEYAAWVQARNYPVEQANAILGFLQQAEGYPVKDYKGLAQLCFEIQKDNRINADFHRLTYALLKYLGDTTSEIERVDQCIYSFVLQKYFGQMNIMFVDQRMYNGEFFTWYQHNSNVAFKPMETKDMKEPYFRNKRIHNQIRPQDL